MSISRRKWRLRCAVIRSEEHTSELQSHLNLVCRLLLEKKKVKKQHQITSVDADFRVLELQDPAAGTPGGDVQCAVRHSRSCEMIFSSRHGRDRPREIT